jgi:8-oxo-dGTP pyrophosphatase MutT (NUDIX family)
MKEQNAIGHVPWTSEDSPEGARPAATLILMREAPDGAVVDEVLMLQRASSMAFAANAVVFPGGALDPADFALADSLSHQLARQDAAARIAAIRETIEEAGVAVGLSATPPTDVIEAMRLALHDGAPLADVLAPHGLGIDLDALTPFARWCPARKVEHVARIFDTRFYVARAPGDAHLASVDTTENVRLRWSSAAQIIADCDAGRELAIFPTRRNLERLAQCDRYEELITFLGGFKVEMVTPWVELRDGEQFLCLPQHLGYPVTSQALAAIKRG